MKAKRAAIIRSIDKHHLFRINYDNGERRHFTKLCDDKTAQEILSKIQNRIALGTFEIADFTFVKEKSINILAFCKDYLSHREKLTEIGKLSKQTLEHDLQSIKLFIKFTGKTKSISQIAISDIDSFIAYLLNSQKTIYGKPYSPASINSYLGHIQGAWSWAAEQGYIRENIFRSIQPLKTKIQKHIFSLDEISAIRTELSRLPQRWKLDIFNLALWTGARRAELINIKRDDIVIQNSSTAGKIHLLKLTGKGDKTRFVPLGDHALATVRDRLRILQDQIAIKTIADLSQSQIYEKYLERAQAGYLFFEIIDKNTITHTFREVLRKLKIPGKFHDLRKSFASYALQDGMTIEAVKSVLGHSDIRTTQQVYTEITLEKLAVESQRRREK